jgi:hypothetical protein
MHILLLGLASPAFNGCKTQLLRLCLSMVKAAEWKLSTREQGLWEIWAFVKAGCNMLTELDLSWANGLPDGELNIQSIAMWDKFWQYPSQNGPLVWLAIWKGLNRFWNWAALVNLKPNSASSPVPSLNFESDLGQVHWGSGSNLSLKLNYGSTSWCMAMFFTSILCSSVIFINVINKCTPLQHWKFHPVISYFIFEGQ